MQNKMILLFFILGAVFSGPVFSEGLQEVGREKPAAEERAAEEEQAAKTDGTGKQTEGPVEITISALKGPSGIGMVKLLEETPAYGRDVKGEYRIAGSPDVLVSRLLSEEVDIATLPTNLAVKLYNKGVPYRFGAVTGFGLLYLLSRDPGVRGIEDLEGKSVYNIGRGATPEFMLRYLLSELGIDPEEDVAIRFTYGHPELAKMLIAGKVATGVLPEPFVTQVLMKSEEVRIAADFQRLWRQVQKGANEGGADTTAGALETEPGAETGSGTSYPMTCVVIREGLLEDRPETVAAFLASYRSSIEWVTANPKKAGELSQKHGIGMPAPVAAAAVPRLNLTFVPGSEAKEMMNRYLQVLLDFDPDSIGGKLPDGRFYGGE